MSSRSLGTLQDLERFVSKITRNNGCWEFQSITNEGYGQFSGWRAHRYILGLLNRLEGALVTDHLCRNRACVNPDHLEVTTQQINARRGISTKLSEKAIKDIATSLLTAPQIAEKYDVSRSVVVLIRRGHAWSDLTGIVPKPTRQHPIQSCRNGHDYTPETTYVNPRGHRSCQTCLTEQKRKYDLKRGVRHV